MMLLKINYFQGIKLSLKLITCKYVNGSLNSTEKRQLSTSIADDADTSDSKQAEFIQPRLDLWTKLKAEFGNQSKDKQSESIKVELQYGRVYDGTSWQSTPYQIYKAFNKKLASEAIVASVNNELWDLDRPLEKDCKVELLTFDNPLAREVLWHSSAHVLGATLETIYGSMLITGPPTHNGFFYDVFNFEKNVRHIFEWFFCFNDSNESNESPNNAEKN